jgi:RNA polymerase sigma-70 factor (ECF subfamily)
MANDDRDDAELMARLGAGDMTALDQLAQRHQGRIFVLAYRLLGDWHRAEDVVQETFLRLRQAARSYEPQAKFTTWLYRIVHNLSIDQQRRAGGTPRHVEAALEERQDAPADDAAARRECARLVQKAVAELPDRQRQVVVLHRYEGLSHTEISEVTGWSKSAVESLLVRAYENLREKLARCGDSLD